MSDSLWPQELQHARPPCPSLFPRACSNSCPLSQWYHPTVSSFVVPFSSCLQSFPSLMSFPMSQLLASGGQSIGASASVLPMTIQDWFPLRLIGLISLLSKGLSRVFSSISIGKHQFFGTQPSLCSSSHTVHDRWRNHSFDQSEWMRGAHPGATAGSHGRVIWASPVPTLTSLPGSSLQDPRAKSLPACSLDALDSQVGSQEEAWAIRLVSGNYHLTVCGRPARSQEIFRLRRKLPILAGILAATM